MSHDRKMSSEAENLAPLYLADTLARTVLATTRFGDFPVPPVPGEGGLFQWL